MPEADWAGRTFRVHKWTLKGKPVCKPAWRLARDATSNGMNVTLALVCRGYGAEEKRKIR